MAGAAEEGVDGLLAIADVERNAMGRVWVLSLLGVWAGVADEGLV